jgi:hypothetical protein
MSLYLLVGLIKLERVHHHYAMIKISPPHAP